MSKKVYLSLGSNVGDREANLREALVQLASPRLKIARLSNVYETDPVDDTNQPEFLNVVVEIETDLFPMQLIKHTQRIEKEMGREQTRPKGPRIIDIDILLYEKFVIQTPQLTVPHLRMHLRRFVLEPLAELAPQLRHPVTKRTVTEMRATVRDQGVRRTSIRLQLTAAPEAAHPTECS